MKFMHIGDLHIGKTLGNFNLIEDQKYIFNQILNIAEEHCIDGVFIAGDVYDSAVPSEAAIELLDYFLLELAKMEIAVFMVSGNHDSEGRLNYGSALFETNQIYISAIFDGRLHKKSIIDGDLEVDVYMLPFVKASLVKYYYPDEGIKTYEDAVRTIIKHTSIDKEKKNILIAHQFVAGKGGDPTLAGSEGIGTKNVGMIEKIGYDCFDDFDYVALGHIHSSQKVGREEIRYSGSPLKYSFSEVNNDKSVPIVTISSETGVDIEFVPLRPMRNMRHIKGKMTQLLSAENVMDNEDFIYVTLTDEEIIDNVMAIFQQTYPNTVQINYDNSHTKIIQKASISAVGENKSFTSLIAEFYQKIYGCDITEDEMAIMQEVAREAGLVNETN